MQRVSNLIGAKVFKKKVDRKGKTKDVRLGRMHMAVFSPDGRRVVGFQVMQPDMVGVVKRPDLFMAFDSYRIENDYVYLNEGEATLEQAARDRLGLDWDRCIMWTGMDCQTESGKQLGYVGDCIFDERTGAVRKLCVGDGSVAKSLVGQLEIPVDMLKGYRDGWMIVDDAAPSLQLSGGVAAAAGEGYARVKQGGQKVVAKASAASAKAVDKGSFALGKALGKAKRALSDATAEPEEQMPSAKAGNVQVSPAAEPAKLKGGSSKVTTYAPTGKPAAKRPTAKKGVSPKKKTSSTSDKAARSVGRQLGKMGGMFGSFMDEYKKASK